MYIVELQVVYTSDALNRTSTDRGKTIVPCNRGRDRSPISVSVEFVPNVGVPLALRALECDKSGCMIRSNYFPLLDELNRNVD